MLRVKKDRKLLNKAINNKDSKECVLLSLLSAIF